MRRTMAEDITHAAGGRYDAPVRSGWSPCSALGVAVALSFGVWGCARPPMAELGLVAVEGGVVQTRTLAQGVRGEHCFSLDLVRTIFTPPWRARLADHGRAIGAALDSVPTADVLTDVRVQVRVEQYLLFQRICAIATGDAGQIE